ncbi:hypothetical protein PssB301D_03355 [Pseudomonas syringae pv. syringae str. B301D-R]|nr:hypothetical protein PsyrB_06050 [Pseudomonas syringae pv. syringae B301D]EXL30133.1 hypothetical protein PssB301D_03355 [Pseudomonas syringae pv. syringae str. B301D-R]SOP96666.1 hypothetical protein CFBP4215_01161 [Pseudomonas syringae pv. syringae]SOQ02548.1 hypothetical protein CFBP2118_04023 [Pseudomonas syringae pv. syringae]
MQTDMAFLKQTCGQTPHESSGHPTGSGGDAWRWRI